MFFTKFPHRANFTFASGQSNPEGTFSLGRTPCKVTVDAFEGDVYRVCVASSRFRKNRSLARLTPPSPGQGRLQVGDGIALAIPGVLQSARDQAFGVSGSEYLFQFAMPEGTQYYGMGEKTFDRMELSGLRTKFWNTDVWSDFHFTQWLEHPSDPPYLSVPYLIARTGDTFVGLLLNTSWPAFMETPGNDDTRVFVEWQRTSDMLTLGAEGGTPELWILVGPTLKALTRKLQRLVGTTPRPPLWALGYHQSRWEYGSDHDIRELDAKFQEHGIPCDGLWLDIDYMDGYRVFTVDEKAFPEGPLATARALAKRGRNMVPILDPGVKKDPGYAVYDDGVAHDVFCRNPEGTHFVGLVWPGETVFPDFTIAKGRKWWSRQVERFARLGFEGCWIDMNDPSTGPVDPGSLLFNHGREPHAMHRNEYALGMQMATFDGFKRARRNRRPFILSRSGSIGTSRYAAIWTGDNVANYFYLRSSIPTSLNLSLSGVPFNGPDCGGFGGDPTDQLICDWFKAGFLFPVFRNHSMKGSRQREPWNFPAATRRVLTRYIRLRYALLPYLYNLFVQQESEGDPILRPLGYEFEGGTMASDAFLVGDAILQAPIVSEKERSRSVELPKGRWMDARTGEWVSGTLSVQPTRAETPLYLRNGAVLPTSPGAKRTPKTDLRRVEFWIALDPSTSGEATCRYVADDGRSYGYQSGKQSEVTVTVTWSRSAVDVSLKQTKDGFGPIRSSFVLFGGAPKVTLNGQAAAPRSVKRRLTGRTLEGREFA